MEVVEDQHIRGVGGKLVRAEGGPANPCQALLFRTREWEQHWAWEGAAVGRCETGVQRASQALADSQREKNSPESEGE